MKKIVILTIAIGLFLSSCLPAPTTDLPAPTVDLNATAAILVQQTIQALPSNTTAPSNTPVIALETPTTSSSATSTGPSVTPTGTLPTQTTGSSTATKSSTAITTTASITLPPNGTIGATETLHPRFYGTLPPSVPYNSIELVNKSKAEAYISLQVTTADGSVTILEYPVGGLFSIQAPVGKYKYVAWVGGNKLIGAFSLSKSNDIRITIYKDRIEIKNR
jgi:hypothetical protein